jgi:alpha-glucosidase
MTLLRAITVAYALLSFSPVYAQRKVFSQSGKYLGIEALDDDVLHVIWSNKPLDETQPFYLSPLVPKKSLSGPKRFSANASSVRTESVTATVDNKLCVRLVAEGISSAASLFCPKSMNEDWKTLGFQIPAASQVYGFGQIFPRPGSPDSDWIGQRVTTAGDFGNNMQGYAGGAVGDTMFPAFFAIAEDGGGALTILDNIYKQDWDLVNPNKWNVGMFGDDVGLLWIPGPHPKVLRRRLMDIVGRAPVPPRKMFGYWMSEYGYDNWKEIKGLLQEMRRDQMPIDGFFLDLQWFGGVKARSDYTRMGTLTFDTENFPKPAETIAKFRDEQDIGFVAIEEPYVGRALEEHQDLEKRGFLAFECDNPRKASYLTANVHGNHSEWWGRGGLIDYSNPAAGDYWHDLKRIPLMALGLLGHWMDLGEPEMFDKHACYYGLPDIAKKHHGDIHNVFSLKWAESVYRGYARQRNQMRPFLMLRSGNLGLQRYGGALWPFAVAGTSFSQPFAGKYSTTVVCQVHRFILQRFLRIVFMCI